LPGILLEAGDFSVWPDDNRDIVFLEPVKMACGANIRTSRMILLSNIKNANIINQSGRKWLTRKDA